MVQRNNTFLLVGGTHNNDDELNTIYEYGPIDEGWTLLKVRLAKPRQSAGAVLVKKGWVV